MCHFQCSHEAQIRAPHWHKRGYMKCFYAINCIILQQGMHLKGTENIKEKRKEFAVFKSIKELKLMYAMYWV